MARGRGEDGPHAVDRWVGRRVCEQRIRLGYSQSDLGAALGVSFQQVQKYEKGANRISASKLFEIAQFFKSEIGYFFDGFTDAQPGMAEPSSSFSHDHPSTRQSLEISAIAPRLPLRQQKIILTLMREMADGADQDDAED